MGRFLNSILFIGMLVCAVASAGASGVAVGRNSDLLHRLDTIIRNHQHYISIKEHEIANLKESLGRASSLGERISITRLLCEAYLVYNADSALHYASAYGELLESARSDDMNQIAEWRLNEANIYAIMGLFRDAEESLGHIVPSRLDRDMRIRYYQTMQYVYSIQSLYTQHTKPKRAELDRRWFALIDTLRQFGATSENLWVGIAAYVHDRSKQKPSVEEIQSIKEQVDATRVSSRRNAINAYWLSRYYGDIGDEANMVRYLTLAAINDAEIENREVAAIQELAVYLYDHGDVRRAYDYLSYCSEIANAYQNRNRMISISNVFPEVRTAYKKEIDRRDRQLKTVTILISVLLVLLIASLVFIVSRVRTLRKTKMEVESLNRNLHNTVRSRDEAIADLQRMRERIEENNRCLETANQRLVEANGMNRSMLAMAFRLTSDYIGDFENFRKKMLKKFTLRQLDEARMDLDDPLILDRMRESFNRELDNTILSVFPNFTEEYNALASDDSKVDPDVIEKNKTLTTKMRIYAVRRLGVDKSAEIAKMLNISIRTVYNNKT